ncbi:MAG: hypothetical protein WCL38_08240, partial [Actinomycetota bacterium]
MLFTRNDVEEGLQALLKELHGSDETSRICIVGGAAIALQLERDSLTSDIDALHLSTLGIREAANRVAEEKHWPITWLNDAAKMWSSHFDSDEDWELRFNLGNTSIFIARPPLLLA